MLKDVVELKAQGKPLPPKLNFTKLLTLTAYKEVTMPVDKILGLYSIAKHLGWHLSAPDYNKPVSQVFIEATQFAIQSDQSLDILNFAGWPSSVEGLPSWAANPVRLPRCTFTLSSDATAERDSSHFLWFDPTGRQLTLMGRMIDVVSVRGRSLDWDPQQTIFRGAVPTPAMSEVACITIQERIYTFLQQQQHGYDLNGASLDHAFAVTLFLNISRDEYPAELNQLYSRLRTQLQSSLTPSPANPKFGNALELAVVQHQSSLCNHRGQKVGQGVGNRSGR